MNLQLGRHSLKAEEIENLKSRQFQKFNQPFIQIRIPKAIGLSYFYWVVMRDITMMSKHSNYSKYLG